MEFGLAFTTRPAVVWKFEAFIHLLHVHRTEVNSASWGFHVGHFYTQPNNLLIPDKSLDERGFCEYTIGAGF